jgi:hypothetical protein
MPTSITTPPPRHARTARPTRVLLRRVPRRLLAHATRGFRARMAARVLNVSLESTSQHRDRILAQTVVRASTLAQWEQYQMRHAQNVVQASIHQQRGRWPRARARRARQTQTPLLRVMPLWIACATQATPARAVAPVPRAPRARRLCREPLLLMIVCVPPGSWARGLRVTLAQLVPSRQCKAATRAQRAH